MKRWISLLLAGCLLLSACGSGNAGQEGTVSPDSQTIEETAQEATGAEDLVQKETTEAARPDQGESTAEVQPSLEDAITVTSPIWGVGDMDNDLALGAGGRIRITYTGNRNQVQYITDVKQLPDYVELAGYDEAYFAGKALLVVIVTAGSGSFQPQIGGVKLSDQTAMVQLTHNRDGETGTADMATWLLWAEVEAGLDYQWELAGGTSQDDNVYSS